MSGMIDNIREEIDRIDRELLRLLNRRAEFVLDLGRRKQEMGRKLFDPEREKFIFERVRRDNPGPLSAEAVTRLFERIIDESRRLERTEVYDKGKQE
jgi:chorismate mutase